MNIKFIKIKVLLFIFIYKVIEYISCGFIDNIIKKFFYTNHKASKNIFNSFNGTYVLESSFIKKDINEEIKSISYIKIHNQIILNKTSPKVVFYKIKNVGYGNRIYSMLSAFLAAIILDSAILIDWPLIDNYIECPLVNVFKNNNNNRFFDIKTKYPKICNIITVTNNTWSFKKQIDVIEGIILF